MIDIIDGMMGLIQSYLNPENVVMVPFLMFIGTKLKQSINVADNLIPDILVCFGIIGSCIISLSSNIPTNVFEWIVLMIVTIGQGYMVGLTAVGVHQQLKQRGALKRLDTFDGTEDTSECDKIKKWR